LIDLEVLPSSPLSAVVVMQQNISILGRQSSHSNPPQEKKRDILKLARQKTDRREVAGRQAKRVPTPRASKADPRGKLCVTTRSLLHHNCDVAITTIVRH
jgi:hypothetical protein